MHARGALNAAVGQPPNRVGGMGCLWTWGQQRRGWRYAKPWALAGGARARTGARRHALRPTAACARGSAHSRLPSSRQEVSSAPTPRGARSIWTRRCLDRALRAFPGRPPAPGSMQDPPLAMPGTVPRPRAAAALLIALCCAAAHVRGAAAAQLIEFGAREGVSRAPAPSRATAGRSCLPRGGRWPGRCTANAARRAAQRGDLAPLQLTGCTLRPPPSPGASLDLRLRRRGLDRA